MGLFTTLYSDDLSVESGIGCNPSTVSLFTKFSRISGIISIFSAAFNDDQRSSDDQSLYNPLILLFALSYLSSFSDCAFPCCLGYFLPLPIYQLYNNHNQIPYLPIVTDPLPIPSRWGIQFVGIVILSPILS